MVVVANLQFLSNMKQVHFQIPFESVRGIKYRVDIYGEGTPEQVEILQGSSVAMSTDEDNSDFVFEPIRTQTGNISIIDTNCVYIDRLMPSDSTKRPVRLIANPGTDNEKVVWQGFISCESYSQDYSSMPQNIDFPINSVLDVMGCVELELNEDMLFNTILSHIAFTLKSFCDNTDFDCFNNIYIHSRYWEVLRDKKLFNSAYFTAEEVVNGDEIDVERHGVYCSEFLSDIAAFFGCTIRESGRDIYIMDPMNIDTDHSYVSISYTNLVDALLNKTAELNPEVVSFDNPNEMSDLEWMGTDHKRNVANGKFRVRVETDIKDFDLEMSLPDTPYENIVTNPETRWSRNGEIHVNTNDTFYSLAFFQYYRVLLSFPATPAQFNTITVKNLTKLSAQQYRNSIWWKNNDLDTYYEDLVVMQTKYGDILRYLQAMFVAYRVSDGSLKNGLMIAGLPTLWKGYAARDFYHWEYEHTEGNYLYKQISKLPFSATSGWININMQLGLIHTMQGLNSAEDVYPKLNMAVKYGNKWMHLVSGGGTTNAKYSWEDEFEIVTMQFTKDGEILSNKTPDMDTSVSGGLFVPIDGFMVGFITVYIYDLLDGYTQPQFGYADVVDALMISTMDITYAPVRGVTSDKSSNIYSMKTGGAFKDEKTIKLNLSTDAANKYSSSMLWNSESQPTKLVTLDNVEVRPEVDLLHRLAKYFGRSRRSVDLTVSHPNYPLPLANINGLDGYKYLPIAESRNYVEDTSVLTCLEVPDTDE